MTGPKPPPIPTNDSAPTNPVLTLAEDEVAIDSEPGGAASPSAAEHSATRVQSDAGIVATLVAVIDGDEQKKLPLHSSPDEIVVGRGSSSDWQIDHISLSRQHARFIWSGRDLKIEDLASANGTRIDSKPVSAATPIKPGQTVEIGTVVVTFELRGSENAPAPADDQSTQLVMTPEARSVQAARPLQTAVVPVASAKPKKTSDFITDESTLPPDLEPKLNALVFRPAEGSASPDDITRKWDPQVVKIPVAQKDFEKLELADGIRAAWKRNRRPFFLVGATLWMALLLGVWNWYENHASEDDSFVLSAAAPLTVHDRGALDAGFREEEVGSEEPVAPEDRDEEVDRAISAYDSGRLPEALKSFRRLQADDPTARLMVQLIKSKLLQAKP